MKKVFVVIVVIVLFLISGCVNQFERNEDYTIRKKDVSVWRSPTEENYIVLSVEVVNMSRKPLFFRPSRFDIIDEEGNVVDTMEDINAYPATVQRHKTGVYYGAKVSDKILNPAIRLYAVPHIEVGKSTLTRSQLNQFSIEGATTGGEGTVVNTSMKTSGENVHIAIIGRSAENEIVSVMTDVIDIIEPLERVGFRAQNCLPEQEYGVDAVVSQELYAYTLPE